MGEKFAKDTLKITNSAARKNRRVRGRGWNPYKASCFVHSEARKSLHAQELRLKRA